MHYCKQYNKDMTDIIKMNKCKHKLKICNTYQQQINLLFYWTKKEQINSYEFKDLIKFLDKDENK